MASITSDKFPSLAELISLLFSEVKTKKINVLTSDSPNQDNLNKYYLLVNLFCISAILLICTNNIFYCELCSKQLTMKPQKKYIWFLRCHSLFKFSLTQTH